MNLEMFSDESRTYKCLVEWPRRACYRGKFENCDNDKKLFRLVNSLTAPMLRILPNAQSDHD